MSIAHGVFPPLLTPFTPDREIDAAALERLIGYVLDAGVDGVFVLGSSGEVAFHDDAARERVLELSTSIVAGQVPVLAGVVDMQTNRVIQHIRVAEKYPVAGVVATAPFYAITGPEEIDTHFRTLAAATSLPVWAYDVPICVHTKLLPEQLVGWGADGVIAGVKDSSGDDVSFRRLARMNRDVGDPLRLFTGHEVVVDGAYLAGAHGSVPGLGNVDPAGYVRMHRAARAEDWEVVRAEQDRLARLFEIVFAPRGRIGPAAGVGAFKTALVLLGIFATNRFNPPIAPIEGSAVDDIRAILQDTGLL